MNELRIIESDGTYTVKHYTPNGDRVTFATRNVRTVGRALSQFARGETVSVERATFGSMTKTRGSR